MMADGGAHWRPAVLVHDHNAANVSLGYACNVFVNTIQINQNTHSIYLE